MHAGKQARGDAKRESPPYEEKEFFAGEYVVRSAPERRDEQDDRHRERENQPPRRSVCVRRLRYGAYSLTVRPLRVAIFMMVVAGSFLGPAATALATECVARPDVSALSQYCGTPPGPDGRTAPAGPALREVLPEKLVKRLQDAGPLGRALLGMAIGAPRAVIESSNAARSHAGTTVSQLIASGSLSSEADEAAGPVSRVVNEMTGSSGTSYAFRFGLLLVVMVALGLRRFRPGM
jgi:hypothetical protein